MAKDLKTQLMELKGQLGRMKGKLTQINGGLARVARGAVAQEQHGRHNLSRASLETAARLKRERDMTTSQIEDLERTISNIQQRIKSGEK